MSELRPWYKAIVPDTDWNEADARRFDGVPPLDPQQSTPEQIADAARLAADDIALVFRIWPYRTTHPLDSLRALLALMLPDEWYF